jgi:glucose/arabinose dehydrogenase
MRPSASIIALSVLLASGCGGGGTSAAPAPPAGAAPSTAPTTGASPSTHPSPTASASNTPAPKTQTCSSNSTPAPTPTPTGPSPRPVSGLHVPSGFRMEIVARVNGARELAAAPNGDLLVGTDGTRVYVVQNAEGQAANPAVFADLGDSPAAGVALSLAAPNCALYVGTEFGIYRIPYTIGDPRAHAAPVKIASVRPDGGGDHNTTSVAIAKGVLYASVGSSCDACAQSDPTRATIQQMHLDGSSMTAKAVHVRNAIALAVNPATQTLWAGGAGQDALPQGHPYEFFDGVTLHSGVANYGWPDCEENRHAYRSGANCSDDVVPLVEFPAYETITGAAFYPQNQTGAYAFPAAYRGGAFIAMHGSWHTNSTGAYAAPPRVAFVAMNGDTPQKTVNWSDPGAQSSDFISGFQLADGRTRLGRPTGITVGPSGSVFVADDQTGNIYRIRP